MPTLVDSHPQSVQIIKDLLEEKKPLRTMEKEYGIQYRTLFGYRKKHLAKRLAEARKQSAVAAARNLDKIGGAIDKRDIRDADFILDEVDSMISKVRKMLDSADEALQDPDNPDRYFLGPQATEVEIVYTETIDDQVVKKKMSLQDVLDGVDEVDGRRVNSWQWKAMDPRKLLLEAANSLGSKLEILIKFAEELRKQRSEDMQHNPQYLKLLNAFAGAIRKYPDLVEEFERELADGV